MTLTPRTKLFLVDSLVNGAIAAGTTTASAMASGEATDGKPLGPINAVSHIIHGDKAARHPAPSLKYTIPGLLLNAGAVTSWAAVHKLIFNGRRTPRTVKGAIAGGAAISALAFVTDYYVVPKRLTPGFEKRVSNKSLGFIYGTLALSLGLGAYLTDKIHRRIS